MISALNDYTILGIQTTIGFLADVLAHPEFTAGRTHTYFIEEHFADWKRHGGDEDLADAALIAAALACGHAPGAAGNDQRLKKTTPWQSTGKWSIGETQ